MVFLPVNKNNWQEEVEQGKVMQKHFLTKYIISHTLLNKKGILSLICGVENSIFDEVFAFSHPF